MNIFLLADNPADCARMHCDKHCIKMIVEYCQILSTTCHIFNLYATGLYKKTHANHPSTIWARQSKQNYDYLLELTMELMEEYTYRYGKVHASTKVIPKLIDNAELIPLGENKLTPFVAVLPGKIEYCKSHYEAIKVYRKLYMNERRSMCTWKNRNIRTWFK